MKNLVFLLRKFLWLIHIHLQDLFNSAFEGFKYQGEFGMFKAEKNILFQVSAWTKEKYVDHSELIHLAI